MMQAIYTRQLKTAFRVIKAYISHDKAYLYNKINLMTKNHEINKAANLLLAEKLDPKDFPELNYQLQKQYIRYLTREYPWFKSEEMLIDNLKLLELLVEELFYKNHEHEAISIKRRHNLLGFRKITKYSAKEPMIKLVSGAPNIQNPLYDNDDFVPTDEIADPSKKGEYLRLQDIGFLENDVIIVDKKGQEFNQFIKAIQSDSQTGIDCEFRSSGTTKLDSNRDSLVSVLQIAVQGKVFIIDGVTFEKDKEVGDLLSEYLMNKDILKIGHTLDGDITHLRRTFPIKARNNQIQGIVDVKTLYQSQNPKEKKCSLAHITQVVYGKPLSKMDQRSTWSRKPFRRAQIHYAAMDAAVCLGIYNALIKNQLNM